MKTQTGATNFLRKLTVYAALVFMFAIATLLAPTPWKVAPACLLGAMFAHGVELEHELIHQKHFNAVLQRLIGFLLGLPMLVEFSRYTITHGYHHRMVGTMEDEESFGYDFERLHSPQGFLWHVSMVDHYGQVFQCMLFACLGSHSKVKQKLGQAGTNVSSQMLSQVVNGYRAFVAFLAIALILSFLLNTTIFVQLWLLPLVFASPIHALVELPEHWGCLHGTKDCLENTRTILPSPFMEWFTNGNCWHVEHHYNPAVSIDQLSTFHQQLSSRIKFLDHGYGAFYATFFRAMFHKQRFV
jgi:fatty acid desaturase